MPRRRTLLAALAIAVLAITLPQGANAATAPDGGFTFGAVGDNGSDGPGDPGDSTSRTLRLIGEQRPAFVQSLGDLAYDASAASDVHDGASWCTWTNAQIARTSAGTAVPYIIAAGNHEAQDAKPGFAIEDYTDAASCADPFAAHTSFPTDAATDAAKDSFYDYPADRPLLRMININPGLDYHRGGLRDYSRGGTLYNWIEQRIDEAKAKAEWVVLTYHVAYLNAGSDHGADMSTGYYAPVASQFGDVFALAAEKRVDLILNGHEHNYQRSKQLQLSEACPVITHDTYDAACVTAADGSAAAPYQRGAGPVQVIIGTGGHKPSAVNDADGDRKFMIAADSGADNCGYASFAVTATSLTGTFENACSGALADTFAIVGAAATTAPSPTPPSPSPTTPPTTAGPVASGSFPLVPVIALGGGALVLAAIAAAAFTLYRRRR
ncbi:MAG: metallophosphoesterase [Actinobacteria bacterium]|nr:metallophosphoesterase [Actinomycetota bacterium]